MVVVRTPPSFPGRTRDGWVARVGICRGALDDFDSSATNIESASSVTADSGDFSAGKLDGIGVDDVAWNALQARLDDFHELVVGVPWEGDSGKSYRLKMLVKGANVGPRSQGSDEN